MSVSIDYFFNFDQRLSHVANGINTWIGCHFAPYNNDPHDYYCRLLGMELDLSQHRLENDSELDFENYRFQLGIRTPIADADFRPLQLPVMAFIVYALYRRLGITGILVFDVQLLLERYREHTNPDINAPSLFGEVSGKFIEYPGHINDLMKRMTENSLSAAWEEPAIKLLRSEDKHIEIPGKK